MARLSNAEVNATIETARASGTLADFWTAREAVADMKQGRAKPVYKRALGSLPLADLHTRMIAIAVERTLDPTRTESNVVGENDSTTFMALRRTGLKEGAPALDVAAAVDRESGDIALMGATLTSDLPGVNLDPLPVKDGRLDVAAVRGWNEPLRRAYSVPAAMLNLTGIEPQSLPQQPAPLG